MRKTISLSPTSVVNTLDFQIMIDSFIALSHSKGLLIFAKIVSFLHEFEVTSAQKWTCMRVYLNSYRRPALSTESRAYMFFQTYSCPTLNAMSKS